MALTEQEEFELLSLEREKAIGQQTPQQPAQGQGQNILQQLLQGFKNVGEGIINPPYSIAAHALQGVEGLVRGGKASVYKNPITKDIVEPYTNQTKITEPIGLGLQGAAAVAGGNPVLSGLMYGVGQGMEEQKSGLEITGQGLLGGLLGRVAGTVTGQYKIPSIDLSKTAGNIVNSLIRPTHKNYLFGKNPGLGISKEGIVATNMDDLLNKVDNRLNNLNQAVSTIRATPENLNKTLDLANTIQPLREVYKELGKAPSYHSAEINKVKSAIDDLVGITQGKFRKLNNIDVSEAYEIKNIVSKMQNWKAESEGGKATNAALKQVYHNIDDKIDKAIPELKELNSRISNMISAKQAINHRIEVLRNKEPANWSSLVNLPFAVARSTGVKTLLGKLLARGYKNIK